MPVRRALHLVSCAAVVLSFAVAVAAAPRTYGLDEDPVRLGDKALAAGDLARAADRFREAIDAGYRVPFATLGLADVAAREGRVEEAETLYRDAVRAREAEGAPLPEAHARLGLLLLRAGRGVEATQEADLALAQDQGAWEALYVRARALLDQGDAAGARALLGKGAGRKGAADGEDLYHHGLALCAMALGDVSTAENEALLALHLDPGVAEYGTLVGEIYERRGTPSLAISAYEKAMSAPGSTPTAPMLHGLGRLYAREGRWNDARDAWVRSVEADSTYAPALKDLANVFRLGKQWERAARTYLRYLEADPSDADALVGLAECHREMGQFGPAFDAASRAADADPERTDARLELVRSGVRTPDAASRGRAMDAAEAMPDSTAWTAADLVALGQAQLESARLQAARRSLERAIALDPESADAWYQQGMLEMKSDRPDSAAAALQRAAERRQDSALVQLNLGIALYQARRMGEAIPAFRRAVELRPELVAGRLLLAQTLAASDSVSAAETEYRRILETEPGNAKALRGLGFCRVRKADYRGAADAYEAATRAEPDNADAWAGLGNAYLGLSDWDGAERAFGRARAIDPSNPTLKKGTELLEKAKRTG